MASPKTIISFKAAPLTFIPISIALAIIAIIIPIYLYPGFFVADFLNLFPYVIMLIFIFYYNREKYMKLATIEIHEDRLYIIKPSEKSTGDNICKHIQYQYQCFGKNKRCRILFNCCHNHLKNNKRKE